MLLKGPARFVCVVALCFLVPVCAVAENAAALVAPSHKAGLPQLDVRWFPSQVFWLAVHFAVLYFMAARFILPGITRHLAAREAKIAADVTEAKALSAEAKKVKRDYESALSQARVKAAAAREAHVAEGVRERQAAEEALAAELSRRLASAHARIATESQSLKVQMSDSAVDMAEDIVRKLTGAKVDRSVLEQAMSRVQNKSFSTQGGA